MSRLWFCVFSAGFVRRAMTGLASSCQLVDRIATDPTVAQIYMRKYSVSGATEVTPETLKTFRCAIPNVTPAEFHICYAGIPKPAQAPEFAGRTAADE